MRKGKIFLVRNLAHIISWSGVIDALHCVWYIYCALDPPALVVWNEYSPESEGPVLTPYPEALLICCAENNSVQCEGPWRKKEKEDVQNVCINKWRVGGAIVLLYV